MKRCPQCGAVYADETQFCLNDGAVLVEDNAVPPSENDLDDEETIIRHDPIIVDFGATNQPSEQFGFQNAPPVNRPTIIVEKQRNTVKYLLFLIIGLILGGALVLAGLLIARTSNRDSDAANVKTDNRNQTEKVIVSNQNTNAQTNAVVAPNNANTFESNTVHDGKTLADDDDFNGRVITLNAYVRSAPSKTASEVTILPKDDRLKIGTRANPNSPWYQVTCEHGITGWMHGDTIEFTD